MSFTKGLEKTAVAQSFMKGLRNSGAQTVKDTLKLTPLKDAVKGLSGYKGKLSDLAKTEMGRKDLAHALGKSLPSIAALGAYSYAGKKVADKLTDKQNPTQQYYYQQY